MRWGRRSAHKLLTSWHKRTIKRQCAEGMLATQRALFTAICQSPVSVHAGMPCAVHRTEMSIIWRRQIDFFIQIGYTMFEKSTKGCSVLGRFNVGGTTLPG